MSVFSNLFKNRGGSYLGIDLGTGSIKLVELENESGRPRLVTYGMLEIETNASKDEEGESQKRMASIIKTLFQRSGAQSKLVISALPNFSVFSSVISLPKLNEKQLAEAVRWEAKKFVPMPIENVVLDWKILDEHKAKENADAKEEGSDDKPSATPGRHTVRILLTAAPKHLVERYVTIFKLAGMQLLSLETESFAHARSLVGNDPAPVLIADIGSITTDLTVVERGVPTLARSIDVGGKSVTSAIGTSLAIDANRAEQFKRDVGIVQKNSSEGVDDGVGKIVYESFSSVVNEMQYALKISQERGGGKIEKVLLTGGSSFLPHLPEFLQQELQVKVFIANPWARISYPKELEEVLNSLAPRMSIAVGLAMREIV